MGIPVGVRLGAPGQRQRRFNATQRYTHIHTHTQIHKESITLVVADDQSAGNSPCAPHSSAGRGAAVFCRRCKRWGHLGLWRAPEESAFPDARKERPH